MYEQFISSLNSEIQGEVLSDDYNLGMYSTDASLYQIQPIVIVLPKHETDVIELIGHSCDIAHIMIHRSISEVLILFFR